jgi:hypothetical protein
MNGQYILDGNGKPVIEPDLMTWATWYEAADRSVAKDTLSNGTKVSTVFLGLDHSFGFGVPLLWETMIFGGEHDQYQERYASREEAEKGHQRAIELASGEGEIRDK